MLNRLIANMIPHLPEKLVWQFSKRYIAGETIEEGLIASKLLNADNILVTIDLLGELIKSPEEATMHKDQYFRIIERFTEDNVKCTFSIKPTMFGLLIDPKTCYDHIRDIAALVSHKKSFLRIDMEDSKCVDSELQIYQALRTEFPENIGIVLQAYLKRTFDDLQKLSENHNETHPVNIRLCKGIYIESERIAYKNYQEIRNHFLKDLEFILKNKMYAAIATHDKYLVDNAYKLIEKYKVPENRYEFQMLFGVTPELRQSIIDKGHQMRVYVPFGEHWFNYSTRRLKENPKITNHIIKALFVKG